MFTSYYWDLFNMGKGLESVQVERLVLCILTSPFVFYPTYNLWLSSSSQSYILFEVIIFQGGFFWQALLTKAKPILFRKRGACTPFCFVQSFIACWIA